MYRCVIHTYMYRDGLLLSFRFFFLEMKQNEQLDRVGEKRKSINEEKNDNRNSNAQLRTSTRERERRRENEQTIEKEYI